MASEHSGRNTVAHCEYCGDELDAQHDRFCCASHRSRYLLHGARMHCGQCGEEYGAKRGFGCFCSGACAGFYEEKQRQRAIDELNQFAQRRGIAA